MLWTIGGILALLWLFGFMSDVGGSLIHLVLVIAVVMFVAHFLRGPPPGGVIVGADEQPSLRVGRVGVERDQHCFLRRLVEQRCLRLRVVRDAVGPAVGPTAEMENGHANLMSACPSFIDASLG